jgi:hypothetical protein
MTWGLRIQLKIALGIWALVFLLIIAPVAFLHHWKVGTLPVVDGRLSNHRVVEMRVHRSTDVYVTATLEFDGPLGHCKHDDVRIGSPYRGETFFRRVEVAVRTDSCHGYFLLPLNSPGFSEWIVVFLFIGLILLGFVTLTFYLDRSHKVTHKAPF